MFLIDKFTARKTRIKPCCLCDRPSQWSEQSLKQALEPSLEQPLCSYCYESMPWNGLGSGRACFRCGLELPVAESGAVAKLSCGVCLARDPLQYRSIAAFRYVFPLPELIAQIKYFQQLHNMELLTGLFAQYARSQYCDDQLPELLVPVPLHPHREFQRSFNQAELFASGIAKQLGIKSQAKLAIRQRHTPSQMSLSIKQRHKNLKKAFKLNPALLHIPLPQHLAIFDDVVTTGATTQSLALMLKQAGVSRIDIWSLARTPK